MRPLPGGLAGAPGRRAIVGANDPALPDKSSGYYLNTPSSPTCWRLGALTAVGAVCAACSPYRPAAQAVPLHALCAAWLPYWPAAQGLHAARPCSSWYVPLLQLKLAAMERSPAEFPVSQENDFRLLMHVLRSVLG